MTTTLDAPTRDTLAVTENDAALAIHGATHYAVAVSATEMAASRSKISAFLSAKVEAIAAEREHLEKLIDIAVQNGWKTQTYDSRMRARNEKALYYGKLLAAVEAGFTIVPNMDVDVFAIRVKRAGPAQKPETDTWRHGSASPRLGDEQEQRLPIGEGRYESPHQVVRISRSVTKDEKGELHTATIRPVRFDTIEFPLAVAHPVVMDATASAMAFKLFDRIGIVPRSERRGDPIVLGQIMGPKSGYSQRKCASFLLAWFVDMETL